MRVESAIAVVLVLVAEACDSSAPSTVSDGGKEGRSPAQEASSGAGGAAPAAGGAPSGGKAVDAGRSPGGARSKDASFDAGSSARRDAGGPDARADAESPVPPIENCVGTKPVDAYVSDPGLCVYVFASGLGPARQMAFAPNGDLFVNNGNVVVLWDADRNGESATSEQAAFATSTGLNHGLAFSPDGKFVYASSTTNVLRYPYQYGDRKASATGEVVIKGLPSSGHITRTLVFDSRGNLFVSVGSATNVDTADVDLATRGQIRRFTLPPALPAGGLDYSTGVVVAKGMRNEVGLYVDDADHLWGVENGMDSLSDPNFGGDVHLDNPGEEINLVDGKGATDYGYPFCYSEFKFPVAGGKGPATQWATRTTLPAASQQTDAYCQSTANVHPPEAVMQAHWAPLGILRYLGDSLPFKGDFIITSHGSWNRSPAVGRLVARARFSGGKIGAITPIIGQKGDTGLVEGVWDARPVDVKVGPDAALYFSDDSGGRVFKVGYRRP